MAKRIICCGSCGICPIYYRAYVHTNTHRVPFGLSACLCGLWLSKPIPKLWLFLFRCTCNKCDPLYLFNNQRCCGLGNTTLGLHHISGNLHDSNFYSGYRSGSFDDEAFRTSYEKTEITKKRSARYDFVSC